MNKAETQSVGLIRHLYVHFPFCARICPYCAFYKTRGNATEVARFCEALARELEHQGTAPSLRAVGSTEPVANSPWRSEERRSLLIPSTIYFGGGTPTALTTSQLEFLLKGFRQHLDLSSMCEWTV